MIRKTDIYHMKQCIFFKKTEERKENPQVTPELPYSLQAPSLNTFIKMKWVPIKRTSIRTVNQVISSSSPALKSLNTV